MYMNSPLTWKCILGKTQLLNKSWLSFVWFSFQEEDWDKCAASLKPFPGKYKTTLLPNKVYSGHHKTSE